MQCPKCSYKRAKFESAPDWQCPSCGIAYAKYQSPGAAAAPPPAPKGYVARPAAPSSGFLKPALAFAFIGLVGYLTYNPDRGRVESRGESGGAAMQVAENQDYSRARIIMYSLTTCGHCRIMRQKFQANGIPFREYFVDSEPARLEELTDKLQAAGYMGGSIGTPTLEVNGKMMPNNPPFEQILKQARS